MPCRDLVHVVNDQDTFLIWIDGTEQLVDAPGQNSARNDVCLCCPRLEEVRSSQGTGETADQDLRISISGVEAQPGNRAIRSLEKLGQDCGLAIS